YKQLPDPTDPGASCSNVNGLAGRVFYAATRFNPPGANCVSSFDSVVIGDVICLAANGATDETGSIFSQQLPGLFVSEISTQGGRPTVGNETKGATPPPPTQPTPQPATPPKVGATKTTVGSQVC